MPWSPAKLNGTRTLLPFRMGYHHDHDGLRNRQDSHCDLEFITRAERQELQPLEVRRLLWEGATLVQRQHPLGDSLQGAVQLEAEMEADRIRALLPDLAYPLLCVGRGRGGAIQAPAVQLAEDLLNLGYRHVFCLA
ncbi:hypothetical protein KBZ34_00505 [Cyanobium sp. Cruz-8H5]|nr:hypothetical protein [Cyanobium sp. Cruz-8H5]